MADQSQSGKEQSPLLGGSAPKPPEFDALCQEALDSKKKTVSKHRPGTVGSLEPLWQHAPLRLPSGRAVSCTCYLQSLPIPTEKATPIFTPNAEFRFCSVSCPLLNRRCPLLFRPRHQKFEGSGMGGYIVTPLRR